MVWLDYDDIGAFFFGFIIMIQIYMFLAWFSKSYRQRKPGYYSLSTDERWGGGDINKKTIFSYVRYLKKIFYSFFPEQ